MRKMAVKMKQQELGTKRKSIPYLIRRNQGKLIAIWCIGYGLMAIYFYKMVDDVHQQIFEEGLVSMCDQAARMLQYQFRVAVAHAGYVGAAFDFGSIVETLLRQLAVGGSQEMFVKVYHLTNKVDPLITYASHTQQPHLSHSYTRMLDFGDPFGKHQMTCSYLHKVHNSLTALITASLSYVIILLVGHIVYLGAIRIAQVEDDYYEILELKNRAEDADVAKSQLLAAVSHEIRAPVNGILGMLKLLLDTNLSSIQRDYAQTANACGRDLITGLNHVLDTAKIEAGKLELEPLPFDIRSMLDNILSLFSDKSTSKGIELAVYVSDKVPEIVMGDPRRFQQVIINLLENSFKFTEQGHVFVQVHHAEHLKAVYAAKAECFMNRAAQGRDSSSGCVFKTLSGREAADDRNNWDTFKHLVAKDEFPIPVVTTENVNLLVSVEDTGIGIPLHIQDSIFMPFIKAESLSSRRYEGLGLGLSTSKRLIELMGGQMSFVSCPQIGSTFSFTVAFNTCDKTSASKLPNDFEGLIVTVVDSKPVRAAVTRYHLQRLGFIVKIVDSLQMVISMRSRNEWQPDLLLVEKDTWLSNETCEQHTNLPKMILLATFITSLEFEKAKTVGFLDTVIMKPLRSSMVAACLQQVLGTGKQAELGTGRY